MGRSDLKPPKSNLRKQLITSNSTRDQIIRDFKDKSKSYFNKHYVIAANPERLRRYEAARELIRGFVTPGMSILDVGAGPAVMEGIVRACSAEYYAVDFSWDNLIAGRARCGDLFCFVGDLAQLPVPTGKFDGVVSLGCLEYVPRIEHSIAELCRVVRPGGFVLASLANLMSPRRLWDEGLVHRVRSAITKDQALYKRYLHSLKHITRCFEEANARVERVMFLNQGLLGCPLSNLRFVSTLMEGVTTLLPTLSGISAEYLVVVRNAS